MSVSTRGCEKRAAILVLVSIEVFVVWCSGLGVGQAFAGVPVDRFDSIQEAIDRNPGRVVTLDGGVHTIDQPLRFTTNNSGLDGDGIVIQRNSSEPVIVVADAEHIRIAHVTLSRPEDIDRATASAVLVARSSSVTLDDVRVLNNRSQSAAVGFEECQHCTIKDCEVVNYKCFGVDDRTANPMLGYAFNCIDGTGIAVRRSRNINIRSNRVIERVIRPTRENQEKYDLGKLTDGTHPTELGELGRRAVKDDYTNNWHQGSAIFVGDPSRTKHVHIVDNYIENAAQGVDMHCDQTVCARNIISGAMIGLKATHGARNLVLANNIVSRADLWGILLNPGAGSHYGELDEDAEQVSNVDGGTAIANNVITEMGYGDDYWHYGGAQDDRGSTYAIALQAAQLQSNPPLRNVLILGNVVYDVQSEVQQSSTKKPNYRFAVHVESSEPQPINITFSGNSFAPGAEGISNIEIAK